MMDDMKGGVDLLFFSRDIGGTLSIIPLYYQLHKQFSTKVFAKDHALSIWHKEGIDAADISLIIGNVNFEGIIHFLLELEPKGVITGTSFDDRTEYLIWKACNELHISSFASVDSWCNYESRFSNVFDSQILSVSNVEHVYPSWILCIDDIARKEMINCGIPDEKIIIAGYLHLLQAKDNLISNSLEHDPAEYRNKILGERERKIILFISEPYYNLYTEVSNDNGWGYDERSIYSYIKKSLRKKLYIDKYIMIIRPHPKENPEFWNEEYKKHDMPLVIDNDTDLLSQINAADLIIGMQSQVLNEAACIGKRIISVQIGLKREEPLFLSKKGIIGTILDEKDLDNSISSFFEGNMNPALFDPYDKDCKDTIKIIKEIIKDVQVSN